MPLPDALRRYHDADIYPMHMPGHKRNPDFSPLPGLEALDVTEVEGLDDLHDPRGLLLEAMGRAAALYGSQRAFYLVNGSSCGILAAIFACTRRGDRILAARNCHRSVYNAVMLRELDVTWLAPDMEGDFGFCGSVSPAAVAAGLTRQSGTRLIVLTSPTYEGVASDIRAIAALARERGIPLLVDAAHGAHFGFSPSFPENAVAAGADLVVHSLHKTLPAPTQTALLHVSGSLVSPEEVRRQLAVFQTSSPSYVLMAGIDACVGLLEARSGELFARYGELLGEFYARARALEQLRVFGPERWGAAPEVYAFDPGKLLISTKNTACGGQELLRRLREEHHVQLEMAMGDYALAMTGLADTAEGFARLIKALQALDAALPPRTEEEPADFSAPIPECVLPMHLAQEKPVYFAPLRQSLGGVCREFVYAYPPGIPLLVPGERVDARVLAAIEGLLARGVPVKSGFGRLPGEIALLM